MQKQKGGITQGPQASLNLALYTFNYLKFDDKNLSAAMKYAIAIKTSKGTSLLEKTQIENEGKQAMWHGAEGLWHGPGKIIIWGKGYACVSTGKEKEQWVPVRRLRLIEERDNGKKITGQETESSKVEKEAGRTNKKSLSTK